MGDRANVVIREGGVQESGEAVFLYTHWSGTELPETVRRALDEGRGRWDDEEYLARIVFERMISSDLGSETGYGISTRLGDNEYDLIVLFKGNVYRLPEAAYAVDGFAALAEADKISFVDYVAEPRTWDNLTDVSTTVPA